MTGIERVRVLQGHTSQQTAYLVEDYPYGRQLRCRIRYWIDTATRGAKKGQQRFMRQTTDARRDNSTWNKPHASTYTLLTVMYLDGDDHVQWTGVSEYGLTPQCDAWWRYRGIVDQLTDEQRRAYDQLVRLSRHRAKPWQEWNANIAAIAGHLRATGEAPAVVNNVWDSPTAGRVYLPSEHLPVYMAAGRDRLTGS
jgi:hypothetical protein